MYLIDTKTVQNSTIDRNNKSSKDNNKRGYRRAGRGVLRIVKYKQKGGDKRKK